MSHMTVGKGEVDETNEKEVMFLRLFCLEEKQVFFQIKMLLWKKTISIMHMSRILLSIPAQETAKTLSFTLNVNHLQNLLKIISNHPQPTI